MIKKIRVLFLSCTNNIRILLYPDIIPNLIEQNLSIKTESTNCRDDYVNHIIPPPKKCDSTGYPPPPYHAIVIYVLITTVMFLLLLENEG